MVMAPHLPHIEYSINFIIKVYFKKIMHTMFIVKLCFIFNQLVVDLKSKQGKWKIAS